MTEEAKAETPHKRWIELPEFEPLADAIEDFVNEAMDRIAGCLQEEGVVAETERWHEMMALAMDVAVVDALTDLLGKMDGGRFVGHIVHEILADTKFVAENLSPATPVAGKPDLRIVH